MQKWMDSVPGQTFLNYAYSWGAAVVILGTLFKLTHLPGANLMLFIGMGTEVFVFFISAFDRPFDKSTIDMTLDNHMSDEVIDDVAGAPFAEPVIRPQVVSPVVIPQGGQPVVASQPANVDAPTASQPVSIIPSIPGSTVIIGKEAYPELNTGSAGTDRPSPAPAVANDNNDTDATPVSPITFSDNESEGASQTGSVIGAPAPAVSVATAEAMEAATTAYVERLEQLNETLQKVEQLSSRLATDSEEMENLNRTLTGIARVYEMQLKSASQQITTQDSINEQTQIMADKIKELNSIYTRMIEAMTTNMPKAS